RMLYTCGREVYTYLVRCAYSHSHAITCSDHSNDDNKRRIGYRRESHELCVVLMGVAMRLHVENLRRSGLAAGSVAGNPGTAFRGTAQHYTFHHLAHGDGGLGPQNALRGFHGDRKSVV